MTLQNLRRPPYQLINDASADTCSKFRRPPLTLSHTRKKLMDGAERKEEEEEEDRNFALAQKWERKVRQRNSTFFFWCEVTIRGEIWKAEELTAAAVH